MQPRIRSVDGIARPIQPQAAAPPPAAKPVPRRSFAPPPALQPKQHRRWWRMLLFPAVIIFSLTASFLVQSQPLGMAAITVYAVVAWVKKIPSRHTFIMAFMALAAVVLLLLVRQNVLLASNFSTYTFLLLVVGIVSVLQESQSYPKHRNSKILNLRRKKRL